MMGALALAWLLGETFIAWRSVKEQHMPPSPRQLAVASGLFAFLAILAEYEPARNTAIAFAFGIDLMVLTKVLPGDSGSASIKANPNAVGWASIGDAGNTVVFPNGTASSIGMASASTGTSDTTGTSTAAVDQTVSQYAAQAGWNSAQISDWNNVIQAESGGNPQAKNPSSGAYGIAQALGHGNANTACPSTGINEYGGFGLSDAQAQQANCGNAALQLLWMFNYIKSKYTTPSAAWASEQSNHEY
jgi:hypothetical protein